MGDSRNGSDNFLITVMGKGNFFAVTYKLLQSLGNLTDTNFEICFQIERRRLDAEEQDY